MCAAFGFVLFLGPYNGIRIAWVFCIFYGLVYYTFPIKCEREEMNLDLDIYHVLLI